MKNIALLLLTGFIFNFGFAQIHQAGEPDFSFNPTDSGVGISGSIK